MSGIDLPNGLKVRKGASDSIKNRIKEIGGIFQKIGVSALWPMQIVISRCRKAWHYRADEAHGVAPLAPEPVIVAFRKQIPCMNDETRIGGFAVGGPDRARPKRLYVVLLIAKVEEPECFRLIAGGAE